MQCLEAREDGASMHHVAQAVGNRTFELSKVRLKFSAVFEFRFRSEALRQIRSITSAKCGAGKGAAMVQVNFALRAAQYLLDMRENAGLFISASFDHVGGPCSRSEF
ncbi:unnamed protein product [Prorocentrum cordatum]|uniref:Uncharacterized protein n=1 Tax=Prorocentrum cordatum TaxID=2364126 RepID=A0ABN9VC92_9DINO|nr:unnamed protein product [Polarella glacialis]